MPHMPFTDADILALAPKAKTYKVYLGKGAFILVRPDGRKYWRLKYRLDGKENDLSLGVFPKVSVNAAEAARESARALIRKGINPSVARREARAKAMPAQSVIRLGLSKDGALTIETDTIGLTLAPRQTEALTAFLVGKSEKGKGCHG